MRKLDFAKPTVHTEGQTLLELIIAIGIFVIGISSLAFLILDSFVSGRLASEITIANFLAEEGLEAARSIRDNSWNDLVSGNHGLAISGNNWIFQGDQEDISNELRGGIRVIEIEDIEIEDIDPDRKKVTSQITWQFTEERLQEIRLVSYFTNWQKVPVGYCTGTCTPCENFLDRKPCNVQDGCKWNARFKECTGTCTSCDAFSDSASCEAQSGCTWVTE